MVSNLLEPACIRLPSGRVLFLACGGQGLNYYERHIGDYLKDTAHLSLLEHGVYSRLLDVYYTREGAIPVAQVERLIGVRSKDEKAALANVLDEFFTVDADMLKHRRCDREIARYQDKQRKAKASADARWSQTERNANASPNAMRTHCEGNALQSPVTSNQTPDTKKKTKEPAQAPVFVLPDWINRQHWDTWHSTPKRRKASPEQKQMAVDKLAQWRQEGQDYAGALENAAIGGNQGLFLPSIPRGGPVNKQQALEDRNLDVARNWAKDNHAYV